MTDQQILIEAIEKAGVSSRSMLSRDTRGIQCKRLIG
jgi:hypothetical protein